MWYLDLCTLKHIRKNRELFSDLRPKNYEFIMARRKVIQFQEIETVHLSFQSKKMILFNIVYIPKCNSNLILLGQLRKSGISYHDHPDSMILKQKESKIELAVKYKNLFIFETKSENKAMFMQEKSCLTYLLSSNPQIRL